MSWVRGDVKSKLLASPVPSYPSEPVALPLPPHQHIYQIVKVGGLGGPLSPFLLIQDNPAAKTNMGGQGIAVVGSATANKYFVLSTHAQGSNPAEAEELLDESCP
jgi:CDP-diacylglycerol pyrophosphatase